MRGRARNGAESLTFKKVFDRVAQDEGVRLTNASVIPRLWLNQAEFQADVLAALAVEESEGEIDLTVDAVIPILDGADLIAFAALVFHFSR